MHLLRDSFSIPASGFGGLRSPETEKDRTQRVDKKRVTRKFYFTESITVDQIASQDSCVERRILGEYETKM